jgi:hypothetical protein
MEGNMLNKFLNKSVVMIVLSQIFFISVIFASGEKVAVIAPSVSTSIEARSIIGKNKWIESNPREADFILVVVRSSLSLPLNISYDCYKELRDDAEGQLNISGRNFCVYLFQLNDDDLSLIEIKHTHYKAEE